MEPKNLSERFYRDANGQWWYQIRPSHRGPSESGNRTKAKITKCDKCGADFLRIPSRRVSQAGVFCSRQCGISVACNGRQRKGPSSPRWKGGRRTNSQGYVLVYAPDHPGAKEARPYIREHRLVMEQQIGRYLEPWEEVHHKNGVRDDNHPENLELWVKSHPAGARVNEAVKHCPTCTCCK